jgi:hypothetical protein
MSDCKLCAYVEHCRFCGKCCPLTHIDFHLSQHLADCNDPAAVFRYERWVPKLLTDTSRFTVYGKFAMMKKFLDLPLPAKSVYKDKYTLFNDYYDTFVEHMIENRELFHSIMLSDEKDFMDDYNSLLTATFDVAMLKFMTCIDATLAATWKSLRASFPPQQQPSTPVSVEIHCTSASDAIVAE